MLKNTLDDENLKEDATQASMVNGSKVGVFGYDKTNFDTKSLEDELCLISETMHNLDDSLTDEEILDNAAADVQSFLENNTYLYWYLSDEEAYCLEGDGFEDDELPIRVYLQLDDNRDVYFTINESEEKIETLNDLDDEVTKIVSDLI